MRFVQGFWVFFFFTVAALAQGPPTPEAIPAEQPQAQKDAVQISSAPPPGGFNMPTNFQQVKSLVRQQINKAIDGRPYPSIEAWRPLSTRQKFDIFLRHTYSPGTFAGAGIDAFKENFRDRNKEYERGWRGIGQRAGIELATGESDVFFQQFLIPSLLKQDPRYYRNPNLPFVPRAVYAMSRVLVTHADDGHETFNCSKIIGGSISQALSDLYVPAQRQGLHPIIDRVAFNLVRDAGFNLVHEFWPDFRRKFIHRF
jgi:hypothetical protein